MDRLLSRARIGLSWKQDALLLAYTHARTHLYAHRCLLCCSSLYLLRVEETNRGTRRRPSMHARRYATTATKSSPRDGERKKGRSNLSLTIAAFCRYVLPYNAAISKSNLSLSLLFSSSSSLFLSIVNCFILRRYMFANRQIHQRFRISNLNESKWFGGPFLVFRGISLQISFVSRPFSGWRRKFWKFLKVTWWFLNFTRRESFCYGRLVSGEDSRFLISEDTLLSVRADV